MFGALARTFPPPSRHAARGDDPPEPPRCRLRRQATGCLLRGPTGAGRDSWGSGCYRFLVGSYRPLRLGSALFTLVEPHPGCAVEYNRFYERDHFYAGVMAGPHCFSGQRFVATRGLKEMRYPAGPNVITEDPGRGSLLSLYWVEEGGHDAYNRWSVDAWHALNAVGRMDFRRDRVHSGLYKYEFAVLRDPDGPGPEQALDHRYPGMSVVVIQGEDPGQLLPSFIAGTPIGQVIGFSILPLLEDAPADAPDLTAAMAGSYLTLWFGDVPATETWPLLQGLPGRLDAAGATAQWMSPFLPTSPGTDRYMDQL
jgi:hypothetical protein